MEVGILGPLVVTVNGTSLAPSAAKPRQVLALLASNLGRHVSVGTIVQELWGDATPGCPTAVVQTYVKQLRRALAAALAPADGPDAKQVLSRTHTGYVLGLPGADVDAREFERMTVRGQQALGRHEAEEAAALLDKALAVWRGPALVDVRTGPVLETEVRRLDEARRGALESRMSAYLLLGRHAELIGELGVLTARYPLQESLHALLILSLHRSSRSGEALEVYRRLRAAMVGELGIEPSQRLQRLHHAILRDDPALESPAAGLAVF
ncbi:DNA-binding transcriptional activator of the SARP family [Streptomyces sp. 1222.5]|uniref:AfsR/SARP family transcriptional regulator n=1 Tax=unclassified Streptomyces TaxID=2593676 RepID=UPI00089DA38A|nr:MULTISPECIES: AfsR/SARP family transcriptional regulator [unclassified Streptomyces]PKW10959.1 DNA-binding SARP family transcriptional activator [Streptomyces sp. 5112.2]SEB91896.1 DNA-binding transcriptional activator of the SARP family [Streptomyces sp. 1222.5]